MEFQKIHELLLEKFGNERVLAEVPASTPPCLHIEASAVFEVCQWLHQEQNLYFDHLSCLTGIDNGPEKNTMEVVYHLYSIPYEHSLALKAILPRENPSVPSLTPIWAGANWHEREAYDLLGIHFEGHPDLRRILLPGDWEGHPLKKDYQAQEKYHGMFVDYKQARDE